MYSLYKSRSLFKSSALPSPIGYLLGGHVMRLFHGHDEVVAIPGSDQSEEQQRCEKQRTAAELAVTCFGVYDALSDYCLTHDSPAPPRFIQRSLSGEPGCPLRYFCLWCGRSVPTLIRQVQKLGLKLGKSKAGKARSRCR